LAVLSLWQKAMPSLIPGLLEALKLTALSIGLGFFIGWGLAFLRTYGGRWVARLCSAYIEFMRGTPLLVQLFMIYYGLPELGLALSPFAAALTAMSLNTAAYQAEYFRAAIFAIPQGQVLAALSLGFSRFQTFRYVLFPQALRLVLPAWSNEVVYMLKSSSLAFIVGVLEVTGRANILAARTFRYFELFLLVAVVYLAAVYGFSLILGLVERRLRRPGLGAEPAGPGAAKGLAFPR